MNITLDIVILSTVFMICVTVLFKIYVKALLEVDKNNNTTQEHPLHSVYPEHCVEQDLRKDDTYGL